MSIVLDERDFAERKLLSPEIGSRPGETLGRIAKYYYASGYTKKDTVKLLRDYLQKCDPKINLVRWDGLIKSSADYAEKRQLVEIDSIPITQKELDTVGKLGSRRLQRLLFTLICCAKFGNTTNPTNKNWVNIQDKEIFIMANVTVSCETQSLLLNDLMTMGLVGYSHVIDNTNICVCCLDNQGAPVLNITDFRNLGYQYQRYMGEAYITCDKCGITVKKTGRRQKYCCSCAEDINRENSYNKWKHSGAYFLS